MQEGREGARGRQERQGGRTREEETSKKKVEVGEVALRLRALAALAKDSGSIPTTQVLAHKHL